MSENIQSIANGSFVLGQTSATNFQAGPGISITQPSEGTVRIANDETVLYSGAGNTGNLTLLEAPTNFNYLRIDYGADSAGASNINVLSITVPAGAPNYAFSHLFKSNPNSTASADVYKSYAYYSGCNTENWVKVYGMISQSPFTTLSNNKGWTKIYKVVGINRKEV